MIAISEHLRNHGIDPDLHQHTRIPHIWAKLRSYYNLDFIDERENFDDEDAEDRYLDFTLPTEDYKVSMLQRAVADVSEAPTSPPELDMSPPPPSHGGKRKRGNARSKTRAASAEDTEDGTDAASPVAKPTRGKRGRTRAASRAGKAETTEEEDSDDGESGGDDDDDDEDDEESEQEEEEEEEEGGTTSTRGRRAARGRPPARGKRRGRGR